MKNSEIKQLSVEELKEGVAAAEARLLKLRFAHAVSPLNNPMQIKAARQEIARMNTELHARTLAMVEEKVKSGELTRFNARTFLQENINKTLPTSIDLAGIKRIICRLEN
jgi:large subunit ribosomal protein L29